MKKQRQESVFCKEQNLKVNIELFVPENITTKLCNYLDWLWCWYSNGYYGYLKLFECCNCRLHTNNNPIQSHHIPNGKTKTLQKTKTQCERILRMTFKKQQQPLVEHLHNIYSIQNTHKRTYIHILCIYVGIYIFNGNKIQRAPVSNVSNPTQMSLNTPPPTVTTRKLKFMV